MCAGKTGVFLNNTWVQTNISSVTNIPYAGINNYWMRIERVLNLHMNGMLLLNCGNVTGDEKTDACIYVHSNVHVLSRYAITIDLNIKTGVCNSSVCRGILIEMGTPLCTLHIEYSHVFLLLPQNMSCALPCALLVDLTRVKSALSELLLCRIGDFWMMKTMARARVCMLSITATCLHCCHEISLALCLAPFLLI